MGRLPELERGPEERPAGPRPELEPPPGPERPLEALRKLPRPPPPEGRRGRSEPERSALPLWLPLGPELWLSPDFQEAGFERQEGGEVAVGAGRC